MTVVSVILGILLVIGGFTCMFTPLTTFLQTGFFFTFLLLVYGVIGIIRFCKKQAGVPELIVSILAVLIGLFSVFNPGQTLVFDLIVLYSIAAWLVVQGAVSIVLSIKVRKVATGWILGLIVGILGVIAGIYSFAHPTLTAVTAGVLIGLDFVQAGFDMIVLSCAIGAVESSLSRGRSS